MLPLLLTDKVTWISVRGNGVRSWSGGPTGS